MKNLGRAVGGAILTLAFIFGITAATSTSAQAQYRSDRDYQYQRRDRDRNDREREREWRRRQRERARNNGYGNNGTYGTYGNNGRYGNNGGYGVYNNSNQIALNQGYQAGLNTGANDARRGQSYSPERSHYYREANSQAFLNGFVQGYDAGYRQYAGNGGYRRSNNNIGNILGGIFGRP
jgi:hypothetical protein